jgi:hypothetical protein
MKQVQTDERKQRKQQAQVQNENIDFELADTEKGEFDFDSCIGMSRRKYVFETQSFRILF